MVSHDRNETRISHEDPGFGRAKLLFVPIVTGVTLFFGFFYGIKGAIVGCMYGIIGGLFVIHESLPMKKNTKIWVCNIRKGENSGERAKKR